MNPYYRTEKKRHNSAKQEIKDLMLLLGFPHCSMELGRGDVVVYSGDTWFVAEVENTCKHVMKNITRDFQNNAEFVLVVVPSIQVMRDVLSKLSRELPEELRSKVGVMTLDTLKQVTCMIRRESII